MKFKLILHYSIAVALGIIVGFKIVPPIATAYIYMAVAFLCLYFFLMKDMDKVFTILPYLIYTEVFIRGSARSFPYLTLQYLMIAGFLFNTFITNSRQIFTKIHFKAVILLVLFYFLEIANGFAPLLPRITYAIQWNTFALVAVSVWAASNKLTPKQINIIMENIRIASVFLAGIVLVAHLQGKIDYSTASSSEASNGMAPVQLSGYFGVSTFLFLVSILSTFDKRAKIIQVVALVFTLTLMILTFSRGGLYFFAITTLIYFFYNRSNFKGYLRFILLLPAFYLIYTFAIEQSEGRVITRYEQKGSSNRDILVTIGFYIFSDNPLIGIGTGNYNKYIVQKNYFTVESGVHNEYVRAAAEHGIFGIFTYWGFFIALLINIFKRKKPEREYALYFFVLFFLITIHNGLKIAIQPLMMLLAISIQPTISTYTNRKKTKTNEKIALQHNQEFGKYSTVSN
ncbi:MAG: O-antigen ligase family protein [Chitinophagaceae bacterium]|nr:O-antigen ligase family protein [Chitinophagaceae bacterium]MCW5904901.1 O-antigen ligase family protein [Chitinophagaceae bacterium]